MSSKSILSPRISMTGSSPFSICVPYGQCDMMNASTIGLSDLGMLVGVGVVGSDVACVSRGINCCVNDFPSFVTYNGTSCPSIERITS